MFGFRRFLKKEEEKLIVSAIGEAENLTSGEIRVHLTPWVKKTVLDDAVVHFKKMKMDRTREQNGVLIFLAYKSHEVAIIGDKGINEKVPEGFWGDVYALMTQHLKNNEPAKALITSIQLAGEKLAEFFPVNPDNPNELKDTISYG